MRYELSDFEWAAIKPMLPNKPERRVHWREGNPVTCFACKMLRRNERAGSKRAARRAQTGQVGIEVGTER